jgi:hypothetical protein
MATTAQSLLALYGALDRAVTDHGGPDIEAIVERYLPGSTGPNAGWYDQLLGFLTDRTYLPPRFDLDQLEPPDLDEALTTLQDRHLGTADSEPEPLTKVQLSRMTYAIGALINLPSYYPPAQWNEQFSRTLALAGRTDRDQSLVGERLLGLLGSQFHSRADFPLVMGNASADLLIDPYIALVPLCETKLKLVRGHLCVVLTTEFKTKKVSLNQLQDVVDPLNWPKCLPFFCRMDAEGMRLDNWSRVLEHVSVTCPIPGTDMVTPLKYWKGPTAGEQVPEPAAWVDYELDDQPLSTEQGDGRMVVDEGFIRMTATVADPSQPGVRVRTRKVAGFRDLAFVPAAIYACVMGYADQGAAMLLDGVDSRAADPTGWTDWDPSTPATQGSTGTSTTTTTTTTPTGGGDISGQAVQLAVDMLNECIDDMSKKSAAIATKWASGAVPVAESIAFTSDLAARLATDPWRYLERLREQAQGGKK